MHNDKMRLLNRERNEIESEEKNEKQDSSVLETSVSNCIDVDTGAGNLSASHSLIVPVWVRHKSSLNKEILVYALLDEQSDACFVKSTVAESVKLVGSDVTLKLSTMLGVEDVKCQKVSGLVVRGLDDETRIPLPKTYTKDAIPAQRSQIPDPQSAKIWPHLYVIAGDLMTFRDDIEIGLLIGANCPRAIKPREVIPGKADDPCAVRTTLGWGIIGNISAANETDDMVAVNKVVSHVVENGKVTKRCCFAFRTVTKELITPDQVNKMFERDR